MASSRLNSPDVTAAGIDDERFSAKYPPGAIAPFSGIYRCCICGLEAVSTKGHHLPPPSVHGHVSSTAALLFGPPVHWQLLVAVDHLSEVQ